MVKQDTTTLDDELDTILNESNAQSKAVGTLIDVKDRQHGKIGTDVELKTHLDPNEVRQHAVLSVLNNILEKGSKDFTNSCILGDLIEIKERKAISVNRLSRREIVDVARNPDMGITEQSPVKEPFIKRFFTGAKQQ